MDVDLTREQQLLRESTAKFAQAACPVSKVRGLAEVAADIGTEYWVHGAEIGWFAALIPEDFGGGSVSGDGIRDLALMAETRGQLIQPGPFIGTNVVASAISRSGSPAQRSEVLPHLASGHARAAWVATEGIGLWAPRGLVTAVPKDDGYVLSGRADLVQGAIGAKWLLVSTMVDDGPIQFLIPGDHPDLSYEALETLDITRRWAAVRFDDTAIAPDQLVGAVGAARPDIERQLDLATLLLVADSIGAMDTLFEMTRVYSLDRTAFGRPIGSFQAVKHQLADLSLIIEGAKAIGWAAMNAASTERDDASEVASIAKAWVGDAGIDVGQGCLQVFGGIGTTWEHDLHLFLRRTAMNALTFGDADFHRDRIWDLHEIEALR